MLTQKELGTKYPYTGVCEVSGAFSIQSKADERQSLTIILVSPARNRRQMELDRASDIIWFLCCGIPKTFLRSICPSRLDILMYLEEVSWSCLC